MKHFLSLKFDYFTNFPIKSNWVTTTKKKMKISKKDSKKRMCKNVMLFILFLKFLKKGVFKLVDLKVGLNVLIQPYKQNVFNYLRAPYKNKLSRNQIYNPRFKISLLLKFHKSNLHEHKEPHLS